ncbi:MULTISPECIES: pyruvate kinase [unclassified Neptuniibacter]|jgi:pyruvate kinase|uniref:pyruvate kinase n=1 Tax=unclassified Neptuniibacter TaxID=2630693 RepID=UPI0026E2B4B6|nr:MULTISPECIES: pyruvate kinase [unclassified Neptuniibacter]MDO6514877.1 pyruvate kinase [Neptuniibacter sp. 2_MG-2023]MDO6594546.1 pyruvate kinase [Neptuniibacter sp. 1_MG-2023]
MLKRTKIVATLGPSTDQPGVLEEILRNGVNTVRLNFSHGSAADHRKRASDVRKTARKLGLSIAILGDLQGPKIRIARFKDDRITLKKGDQFTLDAQLGNQDGDQQQVGIDYKALPEDSSAGDILLLDDGRVQLKVLSIDGSRILTEVMIGGPLSNNKGINRQGGGLSAAALTEKDRRDIKVAGEIDMDYIAVSFPRNAEDLHEARRLLDEAGSRAEIIAKIERAETVASNEALDQIILACDGIMVARGDLGVEIGDAELIGVQKHLIQRSRELNRFVITATQMMESMIENPMPTRAEVFDVANAILDGTDAVMLSAETAAGKHPIEVVKSMTSICQGAEKHQIARPMETNISMKMERFDETIARSAMYTANHLIGVKAIICLTESGSTPLWMSRIRSGLPIFALTRNERTMRRTALYRGVEPIFFDATQISEDKLNTEVLAGLKARNLLQTGDLVILTRGATLGKDGGTNSMQVLSVS